MQVYCSAVMDQMIERCWDCVSPGWECLCRSAAAAGLKSRESFPEVSERLQHLVLSLDFRFLLLAVVNTVQVKSCGPDRFAQPIIHFSKVEIWPHIYQIETDQILRAYLSETLTSFIMLFHVKIKVIASFMSSIDTQQYLWHSEHWCI